jgi:hypothetical protein
MRFAYRDANSSLSTGLSMYDHNSKLSHQEQAVEFLATESARSVADVNGLYEAARAALFATARITDFVPIFAFRRVREALRGLPHPPGVRLGPADPVKDPAPAALSLP